MRKKQLPAKSWIFGTIYALCLVFIFVFPLFEIDIINEQNWRIVLLPRIVLGIGAFCGFLWIVYTNIRSDKIIWCKRTLFFVLVFFGHLLLAYTSIIRLKDLLYGEIGEYTGKCTVSSNSIKGKNAYYLRFAHEEELKPQSVEISHRDFVWLTDDKNDGECLIDVRVRYLPFSQTALRVEPVASESNTFDIPKQELFPVQDGVTTYTQNSTMITSSWKMYASKHGGFSIQYPGDWTMQQTADEDDGTFYSKEIILSGKEGSITIGWTNTGYGGGCPAELQKKIVADGKTYSICQYQDERGEYIGSIYKIENAYNKGTTYAYGLLNQPYDANRTLIVTILTTIRFTGASR